jgi:2-iminobutanoate/2-iminopropanoate deaminase
MKEAISTPSAPSAIGPYSQAIKLSQPDALLFASGQIALDPATGELIEGTIEEETRQVMENLGAVIKAAGFSFADVVKTTIFLSDMAFFPRVNEVYAGFFSGDFPARATVAVKTLPKEVRVEIDAICAR